MFINDWIRTAGIWCRKRLLHQLSHNHCLLLMKIGLSRLSHFEFRSERVLYKTTKKKVVSCMTMQQEQQEVVVVSIS